MALGQPAPIDKIALGRIIGLKYYNTSNSGDLSGRAVDAAQVRRDADQS